MKKLKSHFKFSKQERSGIFFLLFLIVLLQVGYLVYASLPINEGESLTVDVETQTQIDALKANSIPRDSIKIYPFNPNFITDFKGYTLGMTTEEIDRLHAFRKQDKFANTPEEFQQVTKVSDSLLAAISPYFKFPEWTQHKKQYGVRNKNSVLKEKRGNDISDLNEATVEDLRKVNGIGEKLSARIIKFRDRLGGFMVEEQLYDVYGLEPLVVEKALRRFKVLKVPVVEKININTASEEELQKLIYLQKNVARRIVDYRNDNGTIVSFAELINIEGFPIEKIDRITLYLSLN